MTNGDDDFVIMNRTRVREEETAACLKVRYQIFWGGDRLITTTKNEK